METLLDLVEGVFESDDLSVIASRVESGKVSTSTLENLYAGWGAWASQVAIPASPGRLTPYAFAAWGGHGADGLAAAWPALIGAERQRFALHRMLIKHLLFCDAVALPDPFVSGEAPGSRLRPRIDGMLLNEAAIRSWVARVLRNLDHYAPLVRSGVIVVVPHPEPITPQEVVDLDRAMGDDERRSFPDQEPIYAGISHAGQAAAGLLTQLRTAKRFPGLDPYFPHQGYWDVFRRMHALSEGQVSVRDSNSAMLTEFLRLDVAQPVNLSMQDVVAIRREGQFDDWRKSVSDGIVLFASKSAGTQDLLAEPFRELRKEVAESVRRAAKEANEDLGWIAQPTVTTTIQLIVVGSSAAAAFFVPPVAAGLAGVAAVPLLATAFRRWRKARGASHHHVAVFR